MLLTPMKNDGIEDQEQKNKEVKKKMGGGALARKYAKDFGKWLIKQLASFGFFLGMTVALEAIMNKIKENREKNHPKVGPGHTGLKKETNQEFLATMMQTILKAHAKQGKKVFKGICIFLDNGYFDLTHLGYSLKSYDPKSVGGRTNVKLVFNATGIFINNGVNSPANWIWAGSDCHPDPTNPKHLVFTDSESKTTSEAPMVLTPKELHDATIRIIMLYKQKKLPMHTICVASANAKVTSKLKYEDEGKYGRLRYWVNGVGTLYNHGSLKDWIWKGKGVHESDSNRRMLIFPSDLPSL